MAGEGRGKGRNGALRDPQEQTPAVEESWHAAEAIANEDVEAASFGIGGGEFGVGERAEEREDAADDPDEERIADGAIELAKDEAGSEEDSRADDGADEEEKEVAFAEGAEERSASGRGRGFGIGR